MASYSEQRDEVTLSLLDTRILVALLAGAMNAYEVARQCEVDMSGEAVASSNAYKALTSLEKLLFVTRKPSESQDPRQRYVYHITSTGRLVIKDRIERLHAFTSLATDRLKHKK